jgi:tetratricopeptide (TPR) repeat protein
MRYLKPFIHLLFAIALIAMTGCDQEGENIPTSAPTIENFNSEAWALFQSGEFESAIADFRNAISRDVSKPEAYLGLGYCYSQLGDFAQAQSNFDFVLTLAEEKSEAAVDAMAGKAAAYIASGDDSLAIMFGDKVIDEKGESYAFRYDPTFTSTDIHLILAQAYFRTGKFTETTEQLDILEPGFLNNMSSVMLLEDDEATVESVDQIDGTVELRTKHSIIKINQVKKNKVYQIEHINYGTRTVHVFGNPIPAIGDTFFVDYYGSQDYGRYISGLMKKINNLKNTV